MGKRKATTTPNTGTQSGISMPRVPDVGERPELPRELLAQILDYTRIPMFNRHLPDGRTLHHFASMRQKPTTLYYMTLDVRTPDEVLSVHWGKHPTSDHGYLRCLTASYPRRYPTWDELHMLRDVFFPDTVDVMSVLPRASTPYLNDHPYMLWLWETPTAWNWPDRADAEAAAALAHRRND